MFPISSSIRVSHFLFTERHRPLLVINHAFFPEESIVEEETVWADFINLDGSITPDLLFECEDRL